MPKMMALAFLYFGSILCHRAIYLVAQNFPLISQKDKYFGSAHATKAIKNKN
jgi:hypothetical protein